jgi:hypothetical protein
MRVMAMVVGALMSACGAIDGCAGEPLPGGSLPRSQTIEAGAQVRLRPAALERLATRVEPVVPVAVCIGPGQSGDPTFTGARYCGTNQAATPTIPDVCGAELGCNAVLALRSGTVLTSHAGGVVRVGMRVDLQTTVPMTGAIVSVPFTCSATASVVNASISADVRLSVDAQTGALTAQGPGVTLINQSSVDLGGCTVVGDIAGLESAIANDILSAIDQEVRMALDAEIAELLATGVPIAARVDTTGVFADRAAVATAIELSTATGGVVATDNAGITFGINVGVNSDADPTTRESTNASEPAACAANLAAPDLAASPWSLVGTSRETFTVAPSGGMLGTPEADRDVTLGMSEQSLDLIAHHLAASGSLCLDVDQSQFPQLTDGILSALVPSRLAAGTGEEPLRVVGRPGRAVNVAITSGPQLAVTLDDYVVEVSSGGTRLFTMKLDATLDLEPVLVQNAGERGAVSLLLSGVQVDNVSVTDVDSVITEGGGGLSSVLPSIVDLIVPALIGEVPRMPMATIAGFDLANAELATLTTPTSDLVVLRADLATLADATTPTDAPLVATIESVTVPPAETIRAALANETGGMLPQITVAVPSTSESALPLEWTWRIDHGMWRAFSPQVPVQISDPALAWQGVHTLTLASRVQGTHGAWTPTADLEVTIDSVGPRILTTEVAWDGDELTVPAVDAVHGRDELQWAYASEGDEPTEWRDVATISRADVVALVGSKSAFVVFVRDPLGNVSSASIDYAQEGGCCSAQTSPVGPLMLGLFVWFALRRRGRVRLVSCG